MFLIIECASGEFKKAKKLIKTIEIGIKQYENVIHKSKMISFYFHFSYSYFGIKDYKNALKQINHIINDTTDLRRDILCFARILRLTIYLETDNTLSIEHLVKSSRYFLSTREKLHRFEEVYLQFFQKIYLVSDKKQKSELYIKLHSELIEITKNATEQQVFFYTYQIFWIESKIKNTCFIKTVKSKSNFTLKKSLKLS